MDSTTGQTEDEQLWVQQAALGDALAFERIMRTHNRRLYRTARSIVQNDAEAEEVLQEAYLRAWRALGSFRADAQLSTWLVRIVANEALGRLRKQRDHLLSLDEIMDTLHDGSSNQPSWQAANSMHNPEQEAMRSQLRRLLEQCIDALPDAFRTVFMLRELEGMSAEEVAQALDIPAATVRTRFFRARSLLQKTLEQRAQGALHEAFSFDGARCDRIVAGVLRRKPQFGQ